MKLACALAVALTIAACGEDESRPRATKTAQATVTPAPTPERPTLQGGHALPDTTVDDMVEVADALREHAGRVFATRAKIIQSGCDRVHEGTLTMACFLTTVDGFEEVVIVWGDPETRDALGYKPYSRLTCAEREQGLARRQAEALARLTHPQTPKRFRPSKAKIQREMRKEFDRRCARGSRGTVPGNEAVEAVVGPLRKVRK